MVPRGIILSPVKTNTTSKSGRTLHSFACEAFGAEHLDPTRYAPRAVDPNESALDAVNALDLDIRPRSKRR